MSFEIMKKLVEINKRGTTIIVVTHEHDLVKEFGGRVVIINGGKIELDKWLPTKYHPSEDVDDTGESDEEADA